MMVHNALSPTVPRLTLLILSIVDVSALGIAQKSLMANAILVLKVKFITTIRDNVRYAHLEVQLLLILDSVYVHRIIKDSRL